MKINHIKACLPVLGFDKEFLVSRSLDLTIGLKLRLPELFSCSEEQLKDLHQSFRRIVNVLPEGSLVHKQDVFLEKQFKPEATADKSFLTDAYLKHFKGRTYLKHECYLYLSILAEGLMKSFLSSSLLSPGRSKKAIQSKYDQLEELAHNLIGLFKQGGIKAEVLPQNEMLRQMELYLSLGYDQQQSMMGSMDFRDHLKVKDHFVEFYSLSDYSHVPQEVSFWSQHPENQLPVSMLYPLTFNLPFSHVLNSFIYVGNQGEIKSRLESSQKKIYSLSKFSSENKLNAELIAAFLEELQQSNEAVVQMHFSLMVFDESLSGLKQKRSEAAAAFSKMNCQPYKHSFDLPLMYWAGMPGSTELPETECFLLPTAQACCFLNFEGEIKNSTSEFIIQFSDRLSGCPVKVDISDEPMKAHQIHNRNKIIIGGSGSGKSYLTNHLLRHYGESQNCHTVLLDVGRSYELLVAYLNEALRGRGGAMHVEYTDKQPLSFNPFVLTDGLSSEHKQTILSVLYTIYKPNLSEIDKDLIAQSVLAYYKTQSNNHSFNTYYEFIQNWIPEVVHEKGLCFNTGEYFFILSKFYRGGEYDYLLNRAMATDEFFSCPFIVFELDNIKDHPVIFPVATLIIIDVFMQKMRLLKGVRKVICIEEAWKAIATPQMAAYIKYFFKTIRKFFGEAIVVTQEIEDVISSPVIRDAIVNNADTKILLDMSKFANKFETISQVLGLNDFQKQQILSVNRSLPTDRKLKECFIGLGSYSRVFALETSRQEYYCYTSEEREKEQIKQELNNYQSFIAFLDSI